MKGLTGSQLAKTLEKKGWELRRVKGCHHVYVKEGNPARISIPIHGSKQLKIEAVGDVGEIWTEKKNYSNISLSMTSVCSSIRPR